MAHEQWFDLAVLRYIGTKEQCKPVHHRLMARQGDLLFLEVYSAWHSIPEKDSFVPVHHLLRNKVYLLNFFLKFLTMLLSNVTVSTSGLTMPHITV